MRRDLDDLVNSLVGNPNRGGLDSGDLTPLSVPSTPAMGHPIGLPGPSALSMSGSGRASRQSDFSSERISVTLAQSSNSATDHVIERCGFFCFLDSDRTLNPKN